jgi:hypothetical protein
MWRDRSCRTTQRTRIQARHTKTFSRDYDQTQAQRVAVQARHTKIPSRDYIRQKPSGSQYRRATPRCGATGPAVSSR